MRRPELDHILGTMLDSQPDVSDLLFTVDKPLQVEALGELKPVACDPPIEKLTPFQTEMAALNLMGENQWHMMDLLRRGSCDTAYTLADKARFRISIFSQRGSYSIVLRKLNTVIPTLARANPQPWPRSSMRSTRPSPSISSRWRTRWNLSTLTKRLLSISVN